MSQTDSSTIIQPPVPNTPDAVRVFAMPVRYRHGASASVVEPSPTPSISPSGRGSVPVAPPVPPKPLAPLPVATNMQQPSHTKKGLLIASVIVLLALLIGGYLLLRSVQKNQKAAVIEQSIETQTPESSSTSQASLASPASPASPAIAPASPFPAAVTPGVDTDSDGLTDTEETIVYETNPNLPDTDADGFLDGNEVFHGYNPNGTAPALLTGAGLALMLQSNGFALQYPSKWTVLADQTSAGSVVTASTGERVTLTSSSKVGTLTLFDWYQTNVKDGVPSQTKSKKGYPMLVAKNQLSAYIDLGTFVVSLVYDTSTKSTIDYLQTFQMMVNSVEVK